MNSLIDANNIWILWSIIIGLVAVSIVLEQKYKWAARITGAIIALIGAIVLANIGVIPTESPVYDTVWDYVVPVAIPLLLLKADLRKIKRESGRMFGLFHLSALGTIAGTFISAFVFSAVIPHIADIAAMMTGSYIGGGVNFVAMVSSFHTPENLTNATIVADNLVMVIYFFIVMAIPSMKLFRNWKMESKPSEGQGNSAKYWNRKEISLKDIAVSVAIAFVVAGISNTLAGFLKAVIPTDNGFTSLLNSILGNMYLIMTTLMLIIATVFSKQLQNINGSEEIGTFLIYIFFAVLGVPASISEIIKNGMFILLFCILAIVIHLIVTLVLGKLLKCNLDELLLASNACIGGPTTAVAMAIAKGWNTLIIPVMVSGIWGYVLGNYCGIIVGNLLTHLL